MPLYRTLWSQTIFQYYTPSYQVYAATCRSCIFTAYYFSLFFVVVASWFKRKTSRVTTPNSIYCLFRSNGARQNTWPHNAPRTHWRNIMAVWLAVDRSKICGVLYMRVTTELHACSMHKTAIQNACQKWQIMLDKKSCVINWIFIYKKKNYIMYLK